MKTTPRYFLTYKLYHILSENESIELTGGKNGSADAA